MRAAPQRGSQAPLPFFRTHLTLCSCKGATSHWVCADAEAEWRRRLRQLEDYLHRQAALASLGAVSMPVR